MRASLFARLSVVALLAACGGEDAPPGQSVQLPDADRELAQPAEIYALGAQDGPEWESFSHLGHVTFDDDDNLYVLDRTPGKVFVYDTAGRFVRAIGSRGRGPGELDFPLQVAVTREGMVVVSDLRRRAFVLFDRDGTYREDLPFEFRQALGGLEIRPHPRAGFVAVYQPSPGTASVDTGSIRLVWHSLNIDDEPRVLAAVRSSDERYGAGTAGPDQAAFLPGFYWGVLPSGQAAVASSPGYQVDVFGEDARPRLSLRRAIEPRPVTAGDRRAERDKRMGHLVESGASVPPEVRRAALQEVEKLRFAETMPVVQDLGVDPAGRIWIRRGTSVDGTGGSIDLLSGDGAYLGTLAGSRLPVAYSRGGRAAYVEEDSLGVQKVIVRRVPAWAAPAAN